MKGVGYRNRILVLQWNLSLQMYVQLSPEIVDANIDYFPVSMAYRCPDPTILA